MEHALGVFRFECKNTTNQVLILIVMEHALGVHLMQNYHYC